MFDSRDRKPLTGIVVSILDKFAADAGEVTTDEAGHYRLAIPPGKGYSLTARGAVHSNRTYSDLKVPPQGLQHDIHLVRHGKVRGFVRDAKGSPIANAQVHFFNRDGEDNSSAATDARGHFSYDLLDIDAAHPSNRYEFLIADKRYSFSKQLHSIKPWYGPDDEASIDITLLPRATIKGRVTCKGKPVVDAEVFVSPMPDTGVDSDSTMTDANGAYSLSLSAPRTYRLEFISESAMNGKATVSVKPDQTLTFNQSLAPFVYGAIAGRVVDLAGRPVAGATILLSKQGEPFPVAITDVRGRFHATQIKPATDYCVTAWLSRRQTGNVSRRGVHVLASKTTTVELRGDTAPPRLRILSPASGTTVAGKVDIKADAKDNFGLQTIVLTQHEEFVDETRFVDAELEAVGMQRTRNYTHTRQATVALQLDSRDLPDGKQFLKVQCFDAYGNNVERSLLLYVKNGKNSRFVPGPPVDKTGSFGNAASPPVGNAAAGAKMSY